MKNVACSLIMVVHTLFLSLPGFSQNKGSAIIENGSIADETTKQPVEGATINFSSVGQLAATGRAIEEMKGKDHLPLAPLFTSIGGVTYRSQKGLNATIRYRYMSDRPANEDNSVVARGYFVTDAVVGYERKKYEIGLSVQNLFDVRWKETQFDTESKLRNETMPVSEIHFTPGSPFFLKSHVSFFF